MNNQNMNIKNPTFGGFRPDAMSRIAKTLGYEGEMSGFQQYLDQNPDKRTQMDQFKQAAMMMARGGAVQKFAPGGTPSTAEEYTASMQKQYGTDSPSYLDNVTGGAYSTTLAGFNNQGTQQPEPTQPMKPKPTDPTYTVPQPMPIDPRTGKPPEFVGGPALPPGFVDTMPVLPPEGIPENEIDRPIQQPDLGGYDPSQGMPEPLSEDVINQYTADVPGHFDTELKSMFTSGKLPADPTDYTISGGSRNWTITYADGTTIKNRARRRTSVENDAANIIPNYINTFKESSEYTQNKAQQDAYREYLTGEASRGVTEDIENIEQRYNEINDQYRQADLELRRLQAQAEDNPDDPYLKALVEEKGQALSDLYDRQQQLTTLYREQRAAEEAKLPTIEDVMKGRATDPELPEGATVEAQKIKTAPDQFIAEGTGQVTGDISYTAKQGQVTKSAGVDQPATATYQPTKVLDKAKAELDKAQAATGTLSPEAVIEAQEGELSPAAMAEAQMFDDQRLSLVPTDPYLKVDKNQLAEAKGSNLDAVKAQVAQSDMLEKAVAETATVQPEELPPPAQIAEDQMAQAEIMTMEGLSDDATAVAAKLEKFTVDDGTLALAMQGDVDALDTVEGQLSQLMKDFDDGTPAWAAGAIRAANAAMAARGLGASSMAGAAVLQAAMESALPIAQQDAATFANMNIANLNNRQQTALSNAAAQQGLQLQNLSNEQAAALANSANAFALQSQNLSNMQSVVIANAQIKSALQGENLSNEQQSNLSIAARFAEVSNLNLTNKQQTALQNNASQLQTNLANLSSKSQAYITNANLEASLQGQVLSNEQQVAINNAARFSEASNITFSAEQQAQLHNSSLMQTIGLAELSSAQAATLQNAAQIAGMDMANLNNRQQAAVENAKSFLQMDLTNLNNEQQMAVFKAQATQQALLSDQAAENASKQFNAQSENQANQFFANLKQQNNQFNAAQANAMEQFNVGQENAAEQFNAEMKNNREQYNAQNELVIAQSNATWRREVATADTAAENRANELNAINTLDISNQAYDNMWNMYGDQMEWAVNSYESEADRVNALTLETMRQEGSEKAAKYAADSKASSAIGGAVVSLLTAGSDSVIGGLF
jgi:hypothetical protein